MLGRDVGGVCRAACFAAFAALASAGSRQRSVSPRGRQLDEGAAPTPTTNPVRDVAALLHVLAPLSLRCVPTRALSTTSSGLLCAKASLVARWAQIPPSKRPREGGKEAEPMDNARLEGAAKSSSGAGGKEKAGTAGSARLGSSTALVASASAMLFSRGTDPPSAAACMRFCSFDNGFLGASTAGEGVGTAGRD